MVVRDVAATGPTLVDPRLVDPRLVEAGLVEPRLVDPTRAAPARPIPRTLTQSDLIGALREGWADFRAAPTQLIFLCAVYPVIALLLARGAAGGTLLPLIYPLVSGFALIGPVAAIGLYEISRRREAGLPTRASDAFVVLREPGFASVAALGVGLMMLFVAWIAIVEGLLGATIGTSVASDGVADFSNAMFGTGAGLALIVVGNGIGFVFALVVLVGGLFSIPLALDRAIHPGQAVLASLAAARRNPVMIALWGLIVSALLIAGSIPAFAGLAIALPVLGHATWHLYRRTFG